MDGYISLLIAKKRIVRLREGWSLCEPASFGALFHDSKISQNQKGCAAGCTRSLRSFTQSPIQTKVIDVLRPSWQSSSRPTGCTCPIPAKAPVEAGKKRRQRSRSTASRTGPGIFAHRVTRFHEVLTLQ